MLLLLLLYTRLSLSKRCDQWPHNMWLARIFLLANARSTRKHIHSNKSAPANVADLYLCPPSKSLVQLGLSLLGIRTYSPRPPLSEIHRKRMKFPSRLPHTHIQRGFHLSTYLWWTDSVLMSISRLTEWTQGHTHTYITHIFIYIYMYYIQGYIQACMCIWLDDRKSSCFMD
jgi:hypothetical protein